MILFCEFIFIKGWSFFLMHVKNSTIINVHAYLPNKYPKETTQPHSCLFDFLSGLGSQP